MRFVTSCIFHTGERENAFCDIANFHSWFFSRVVVCSLPETRGNESPEPLEKPFSENLREFPPLFCARFPPYNCPISRIFPMIGFFDIFSTLEPGNPRSLNSCFQAKAISSPPSDGRRCTNTTTTPDQTKLGND